MHRRLPSPKMRRKQDSMWAVEWFRDTPTVWEWAKLHVTCHMAHANSLYGGALTRAVVSNSSNGGSSNNSKEIGKNIYVCIYVYALFMHICLYVCLYLYERRKPILWLHSEWQRKVQGSSPGPTNVQKWWKISFSSCVRPSMSQDAYRNLEVEFGGKQFQWFQSANYV